MGAIPTGAEFRHFTGKKLEESGETLHVTRPLLYFYGIAVVINGVIIIFLGIKKPLERGRMSRAQLLSSEDRLAVFVVVAFQLIDEDVHHHIRRLIRVLVLELLQP